MNSEHLFCSYARLPVPILSASDQLAVLDMDRLYWDLTHTEGGYIFKAKRIPVQTCES